MKNASSDIWMPFYVGDYIADTLHLTTEQHGAYVLILLHQWRKGHFSEGEIPVISRLSGRALVSASSTTQEELKQELSSVLAPIMQMLTRDTKGLWFSRRCDEEKVKWIEKKRVFFERAQKGGQAKAKRNREKIAKEGAINAASSTSISTLEGMLEPCTSPSQEVQEQKNIPVVPSQKREGTGITPDRPVEEVNKAHVQNRPVAVSNGAYKGNAHSVAKVNGAMAPNRENGHSRNGIDDAKEDSRAPASKKQIISFWDGGGVDGFECPWSDSENRALGKFLRENPDVDEDHLIILLRNRAQSEGINRAAAPRTWLRTLKKYASGPLDRFNRPIEPARRY